MKEKIKMVAQTIWAIAGCIVIYFVLSIGLDVASIMKDVRVLWSQVTIEDVRQTLDVIEMEIEADMFETMTYRGYLTDQLVEWTPENWDAFLDFCAKTGYVVTDENWQRYIHGQLGEP